MNILIFAAYYHPHIGGYERNIHEMAKRLVQKGHKVAVVTCGKGDWSIDYEGIFIHRLEYYDMLNNTFPVPKFNWFNSETMRYMMAEIKWDVVSTQTRFFIISLFGCLFAKIKHIPLVHTERGTCHSVVSNPIVRLLSRMYDHTIGSYIVRSAKVNIGISKSACDFIRHLGGKNCIEICNGVDTEIFN